MRRSRRATFLVYALMALTLAAFMFPIVWLAS